MLDGQAGAVPLPNIIKNSSSNTRVNSQLQNQRIIGAAEGLGTHNYSILTGPASGIGGANYNNTSLANYYGGTQR